MSMPLYSDFFLAFCQTLYMVVAGTFLAAVLGFPLGLLLFIARELRPMPWLARSLSFTINAARSVPFIIFMVALIPFTRMVVGTSIGTHAALVPLALAAAPFYARLIDNALATLPHGLIETGQAMGASLWQMVCHMLLPEAKPALIQVTTVVATTLVNYSAMAGTVGGGGLGDLAIRYGYQRFNVPVMVITIIIMILLVQAIQFIGDYYTDKIPQNRNSLEPQP